MTSACLIIPRTQHSPRPPFPSARLWIMMFSGNRQPSMFKRLGKTGHFGERHFLSSLNRTAFSSTLIKIEAKRSDDFSPQEIGRKKGENYNIKSTVIPCTKETIFFCHGTVAIYPRRSDHGYEHPCPIERRARYIDTFTQQSREIIAIERKNLKLKRGPITAGRSLSATHGLSSTKDFLGQYVKRAGHTQISNALRYANYEYRGFCRVQAFRCSLFRRQYHGK